MYTQLYNFGSTTVNNLPIYNNDPLTYCLGDNYGFNHGSNASTYGQNSRPCQVYLSQRCARSWDNVCEYASQSSSNSIFTQTANNMGAGTQQSIGLSPGDVLLINTAREKYRINMLNCELKTEQFDPINPSSPFISYYVGQNCIPQYAVNPYTIDKDIVMHKILEKPQIAIQMLVNIKNTMQANGTFHMLRGTRLGSFYGL
jgi:hypothetical protein